MRKYTKIFSFLLMSAFLPICGDWHGPIDIYTVSQSLEPAVGVDGAGNAVIVSVVSDDDVIFYERSAQLVQGVVQNLHNFPRVGDPSGSNAVSVNAAGNATAVWIERDDAFNGFIRSSNLFNGIWGAPTTISSSSFEAQNYYIPGVNLDNSDHVISAFSGQDNVTMHYLNQWNSFALGWRTPATLYDPEVFIPSFSMAGSPTGQAFAAWSTTGAGDGLQAGYFNGTSWEINPSISTDYAVSCTSVSNFCPPILSTSLTSRNEGMILWKEDSTSTLKTVTYGNGIYSLPATVYIPSSNENVTEAKAALSDNGTGLAVWMVENLSADTGVVMSSTFKNGVWSSPSKVLMTINLTESFYNDPGVGMDANGNGYAVWQVTKFNGEGEIYASGYKDLTSSWSSTPTLVSQQGTYSDYPKISVNKKGAATIVWLSNIEGNQMVQAVYTENLLPPEPLPPQNLAGVQEKNRFLDQTDIVNILTWKPSLDPLVVKYNLYRNDKLIAEISAKDPLRFEDHNRKSKRKYVYLLKAVNAEGIESNPISVSLP